jgi:hypothetical protein
MDEAKLVAVADACARFVRFCGDARGVGTSDLAARVGPFHDLEPDERFRAQVLLCRTASIAYEAQGDGFRFWWSVYAPARLRATA